MAEQIYGSEPLSAFFFFVGQLYWSAGRRSSVLAYSASVRKGVRVQIPPSRVESGDVVERADTE
ncbi:MAG: hypothetical protein SGI73_09125 [Chloroflexota bacterium]|nr:hypothetical protein [Chloroflexota bacterium]